MKKNENSKDLNRKFVVYFNKCRKRQFDLIKKKYNAGTDVSD